jgi:hypothetical protein
MRCEIRNTASKFLFEASLAFSKLKKETETYAHH